MSLTRRDLLRASAALGGLMLLPGRRGYADAPTSRPSTQPAWPDDPFLRGNFAPVHEEVTADDLKIVGHLPKELDGMFVRNGSNPHFAPLGPYHWFDGDGMLHGVRLRDGTASYRNRYVRTAGLEEELKAGRSLYRGFASPPDLKRLMAGRVPFKNTANTALVWHNRKLLATWEGGPPHEVTVPDLATVGPHTFGGTLAHPFTAHPKVDPVTGEMLCFGYQPMRRPYVRYSVVSPQGQIVHTTAIDVPKPVMMHDFAVTDRHAIFMDLPQVLNLGRAVTGGKPWHFEADRPARFGLLPRRGRGDQIKWFEAKTCFVFHTLNAYEEDGAVVLIGCRYDAFPDAIDGGGGQPPTDGPKRERPANGMGSVLYRWRFDLTTGRTTEGPLDDFVTEFPRIHDGRLGRPTRYGYAVGGNVFGEVVKYDLRAGKDEHHVHGKGRTGGECVFVPRPGGTAEDDGWLVTYVHDAGRDKGELVVLDARHVAAEPVARVLLPKRVPYGFHGTWVGGAELARQG